MSTRPQERLAHNHRFSFTNLVLKGQYVHWLYEPLSTFNEETNLNDVKEVIIHAEKAGDCFTIHHDTLHSTPFTEQDTVSLVLRGNPVKRRAPVMFKESRGRSQSLAEAKRGSDYEPETALAGDMFWRVGELDESVERRYERQMSPEKFNYWVERLEQFGLI